MDTFPSILKRGKMVIYDSFVIRKPLEYTLIVMVIVLIILLPIYLYSKQQGDQKGKKVIFITESFGEFNYQFGPESELSNNDKKLMFKLYYEGNIVQWNGKLLSCTQVNDLYHVSVDHTENGRGDVIFMSRDDCKKNQIGEFLTYKMKLIDRKVQSFIGKDGEIIR